MIVMFQPGRHGGFGLLTSEAVRPRACTCSIGLHTTKGANQNLHLSPSALTSGLHRVISLVSGKITNQINCYRHSCKKKYLRFFFHLLKFSLCCLKSLVRNHIQKFMNDNYLANLQLMRCHCPQVLITSMVALHDTGMISLDLAIRLLQVIIQNTNHHYLSILIIE